jgi:hypothetical protein
VEDIARVGEVGNIYKILSQNFMERDYVEIQVQGIISKRILEIRHVLLGTGFMF